MSVFSVGPEKSYNEELTNDIIRSVTFISVRVLAIPIRQIKKYLVKTRVE